MGKMFTRYDMKAQYIRLFGTQKGQIVLFTTAALLRLSVDGKVLKFKEYSHL